LPRWPRRPIRIVLIEDTRKRRCSAPNLVALRTKDGVASLSDLVRSSLRLRLDRIPVGEVRCAEALDLLKALGHRPSRRSGNVVVGQQLGYVARAFRLKTITAQNAGNKLHYEPVFAANVNKGDADSCSSPASARAGERRVPEPQFNASRAIPRTRSSRSRRILARYRTAVSCRSR
jgi:hypothetical protein